MFGVAYFLDRQKNSKFEITENKKLISLKQETDIVLNSTCLQLGCEVKHLLYRTKSELRPLIKKLNSHNSPCRFLAIGTRKTFSVKIVLPRPHQFQPELAAVFSPGLFFLTVA